MKFVDIVNNEGKNLDIVYIGISPPRPSKSPPPPPHFLGNPPHLYIGFS